MTKSILDSLTPGQLQRKVDSFFAQCDKKKEDYSITGLALYLGVSRVTLLNYSRTDRFYHIIEMAKLRCENLCEKKLLQGTPPTGAIFTLKNNYGWSDKVEIDQTIKGTISLSSLFDRANEIQQAKVIDGEIEEPKPAELPAELF